MYRKREQRAWSIGKRKRLRILASGLGLSMLLTGCGPASITPLTAIPNGVAQVEAALQQGNGDHEAAGRTDTVITGFGSLPDEAREQTVPLGTNIEELNLPDTLEAYVMGGDAENEGGGVKPPEDSDETPDEGDEKGEEPPGEGDDNNDGDIPGDGDSNDGENDDGKDDNSNAGGNEGGTDDNSNDGENEGGTGGDSNDGGSENSNGTDAPETSDSADNRAIAGFSIETGSFVMPVYASENPQVGLTAGTLTDGTGETNVQTDTREKMVVIGNVTWQSDPAYDGSVEGTYTFTAVLPEGYALSEGVSLPQITVTVGSGIDAVIQTLLDRIAALPDAQEYLEKEPDIDNWEGDEDDYEEAYTEWMEGLQDYAKEALAILEEIGKLTEEEQALIPQEAFEKLAAWAEIAETLSENTMVMAAADHTHDDISFVKWYFGTDGYDSLNKPPKQSGDYYLYQKIDVNYDNAANGSYLSGKDLKLCLNGKEVRRNGVIYTLLPANISITSDGATLDIYDCGGNGKLYSSSNSVIDVSKGTLNLYSGKIVLDGTDGAAVRVGTSNVSQSPQANVYGGSITGGIKVGSGSASVSGGQITRVDSHGIEVTGGKLTISGGTIETEASNCYAVYATDGTVKIAGDATLNTPIYTRKAITAEGTGVSGLSTTYRIVYANVKDGDVVVKNSTDREHYQLVSDVYGLAAKDGNLIAAGKYKVTYNKNSGTIADEEKYTSYVYDVGLTLPTPTRENYTFGGWYTRSDFSGTAVSSISATETGNKAYYAKWTANTYTVTYNKNSGAIANESNYTKYTYGTGLTLPTPTRTGYTFGGWYTGSDFSGSKVTSISTSDTGNKTYYAKWTANKYDITYSGLEGATLASANKPTKHTYGSSTAVGNPSKTGYTFAGWKVNNGGTAKKNLTLGATDHTAAITLTATWTANTYTVTYNGNGSTAGSTDASSHTYDTAKNLTANGYTRSHTVTFNHNYTGKSDTTETATYTFAGWNTQADGNGISYTNSQSVKNLTETNGVMITLYAKWTPQSVTYKPTRTGYTFEGWYSDRPCSGSREDSDGTYTPTGNQTLYARWVDETPPAKPVLQSALPTGWTKTQTAIPLTLSDNVGVTKLQVSVDGIPYTEVSDFTGGSGTFPYNYNVSEGNHTYQFKAVDAAGNKSPASEPFRVMLDTENPAFIEGPTAKKVTADSAEVTFTPSEGGKVYWIVDPAETPTDAQAVVLGAQGSAQGGTQEITGGTSADLAVTGLTPGAVHKVYVVLEDAAGNLSAIKEAAFATLPEAPEITLNDLEKDYEKEKIRVPERFGDVEVYTDPDKLPGSIITPGQDGYLPVEPGKPVYIRYPEKTQDGVTIPPSDGVKIDIPGRPAAPPAKEVAVTDTTVTVKDRVDGEEYILVEKGSLPEGAEPDWNDPDQVNETGAFTGLDPNKEYDLYVRKKATEDAFASESAKTEVRTYVTINEPQITGDGAGKNGNTAPKPDKPDEGGRTVTYTGTYGEEYTPVIIVDGKQIIPGSGTPGAEGSEMTWDEETGKGGWKYVYPVPDGVTEADITVEFRKRSVIGITAQPGSLTLSADSGANSSAAEDSNIAPLTAYLKEKCSVEAAYDNRTMGAVPADDVAYTVTDTFAPKGAAYHYTISTGGKDCQTTLTVTPVTASVRDPDTVMQRQKDEGYTEQEAGAWLPAQVTVTYTGTGYTTRTEELAVTWETASLGADFGKTLGDKTVDGAVELPPWATGTGSASIVIRFVDKTPLGDGQIQLAMQDFRYGDKKLPDAQGSITVEDTNPVYAYLYSSDGGTTWIAKENLPKSAGGYIVPGEYQVKMTYTGDQYIGEKTTSFTVAKKQLTVQPGTLAAQDKNYDGTLNAVLKEDGKAALSGIVEGDNVTLGGTLTARFTEAGPKKNIPVTVTGFLLEGADSRYYELDNAALTLHATINNADGTPPSGGNNGGDNNGNGGNNSGDNSYDGNSGDNDSGSGSSGGSNNGGKNTTLGGNDGSSNDGTKPGEKTDGTKPGGNNGGSNDGTKPGEKTDGTKPGGANGSEGNGSGTKPGSGSDPGEGETKIVPAVTEGGRIVIEDGTNDGKIATGNVPGMSGAGSDPQSGATGANTMRTKLRVGDGAVIVRVVCEETGITAGVPDTVAVANAVLTTEQVQLVNDGDTIEIRVEVRDITESVTEQDQKVIESALAQFREEQKGITVGMYVDISMFIKVGDGEWETVNTSDEPIGVVVGIPEGLRADGREYYIIRSHEGRCDILTDMDDAPDTITISTDRFSSYAIAYAETGETGAENGAKCGLCRICPTFLGVCCFVWRAVILAVTLIVILAAACRKKKEKAE